MNHLGNDGAQTRASVLYRAVPDRLAVELEAKAEKEHKTTHAKVRQELHLAKTHVALSMHPMDGKWD